MLFKKEFVALSCTWWLEIETGVEGYFEDVYKKIFVIAEDFEAKFSRFRSSSLIYKLNTAKELAHSDEELYNILQYGFDLDKSTSGLFSPFVGSKLETLGYNSRMTFENSKLHIESNIESKISQNDPQLLEFTSNKIVIHPHAFVDLGGYGKGWLVDKISTFLIEYGVEQFIVNGGGDIFCYGFEQNPQKFYLENPSLDGTYIGEINLTTGAIASSSTNRRRWVGADNVEHNHIIDLHRGQSVTRKISTYTYALHCLIADVSATVLMIDPHYNVSDLFRQNIEYCVVNENSFSHTQNYLGKLYK